MPSFSKCEVHGIKFCALCKGVEGDPGGMKRTAEELALLAKGLRERVRFLESESARAKALFRRGVRARS